MNGALVMQSEKSDRDGTSAVSPFSSILQAVRLQLHRKSLSIPKQA